MSLNVITSMVSFRLCLLWVLALMREVLCSEMSNVYTSICDTYRIHPGGIHPVRLTATVAQKVHAFSFAHVRTVCSALSPVLPSVMANLDRTSFFIPCWYSHGPLWPMNQVEGHAVRSRRFAIHRDLYLVLEQHARTAPHEHASLVYLNGHAKMGSCRGR
jgi:hypothetical protein